MKSVNNLLVFLIILVPSFTAIAQETSSGYIITLEEDTVRGYIFEGIDAELSLRVEFKKEKEDSEVYSYFPSDILGFGFDYGRIFERKTIGEGTPGISSVFAKRIIQGRLNMFIWRKHKVSEPDIFLVNKYSHRVVQMSKPSKKVLTTRNGAQYISAKNTHMGLLDYVKADSLNSFPSKSVIRYSEKLIINDVLEYNNPFHEDFPMAKYDEQIKYSYDFTVGMNMPNAFTGYAFRAALYRNRMFVEKTIAQSYFRGISYRYFSSANRINGRIENSYWTEHFLSIIPIGVKFYNNSGIIRPYFYMGAGLSLTMETHHKYVDLMETDVILSYLGIGPTFNMGVGAGIKVGSKVISIELAPTFVWFYSGYSINVVYSF